VGLFIEKEKMYEVIRSKISSTREALRDCKIELISSFGE
jgi:hypothetical protein